MRPEWRRQNGYPTIWANSQEPAEWPAAAGAAGEPVRCRPRLADQLVLHRDEQRIDHRDLDHFRSRWRRIEARRRLNLQVDVPGVAPGAGRDQVADDDVLFQPRELAVVATDRGIGQDAAIDAAEMNDRVVSDDIEAEIAAATFVAAGTPNGARGRPRAPFAGRTAEYAYFRRRRRAAPAIPTRPIAISDMVAGSGTGLPGFTLPKVISSNST